MSLLTGPINKVCDDENTRGGIFRMWVANRDAVNTFVVGTDHEYSSVTMIDGTSVFFPMEFTDFSAQHTSEGELGDSGSSTKTDTIEVVFPRREKVKATAIQELFTSCKVYVIYQTYNSDKKFIVGFDEILREGGAMRVNVTENTGLDLGDVNGYSVSFNGRSAEVTREFTGTVPV